MRDETAFFYASPVSDLKFIDPQIFPLASKSIVWMSTNPLIAVLLGPALSEYPYGINWDGYLYYEEQYLHQFSENYAGKTISLYQLDPGKIIQSGYPQVTYTEKRTPVIKEIKIPDIYQFLNNQITQHKLIFNDFEHLSTQRKKQILLSKTEEINKLEKENPNSTKLADFRKHYGDLISSSKSETDRVDLSNVYLETERLILRPFTKEDLIDLYTYASDPDVGPHAGWKPHESLADSEKILQMFIDEKKTFALVDKATNRVIGSLGLENRDKTLDATLATKHGREIGYVLAKPYWGRGLMSEAVHRVISYAFNDLDFDFLTCRHSLTNHRSQRVIEKNGFVFYQLVDYVTQTGEHQITRLYILYNPLHREN